MRDTVSIERDPDTPGGIVLVTGELPTPSTVASSCAAMLLYAESLRPGLCVGLRTRVALPGCTLDETDDYIRTATSTIVADQRDRVSRRPIVPWG